MLELGIEFEKSLGIKSMNSFVSLVMYLNLIKIYI